MIKLKKLIPALLVVLGVMLTQGCMRVETEINVNKDGSGTIDVTMLFASSMMMFINSMSEGKEEGETNPFSESKFKSMALNYGEDVELVDYEEVNDGKFVGGRGSFSFPDINAIAVKIVPDMEGDGDADDEPVLFEFSKKGRTSMLKIITPQGGEEESGGDENGEEESGEGSGTTAEQMQMMKGFMTDMYIFFRVNVEGKIVKTNSMYADKSGVTIYEIDMNEILADEELFTAFTQADSNPELLRELDGSNGVVFEQNSEINITFR